MLKYAATAPVIIFIIIFFYLPFIAHAEEDIIKQNSVNSAHSKLENNDLANSGQTSSLCNIPSAHYKKKLAATFHMLLVNGRDICHLCARLIHYGFRSCLPWCITQHTARCLRYRSGT